MRILLCAAKPVASVINQIDGCDYLQVAGVSVDNNGRLVEGPEALYRVSGTIDGEAFAPLITLGEAFFDLAKNYGRNTRLFPQVAIGEKVCVPHGIGTVIGFERFDSEGMSAPHGTTRPAVYDSRTIIRLDAGHSWPFDGDYAASRKDLSPAFTFTSEIDETTKNKIPAGKFEFINECLVTAILSLPSGTRARIYAYCERGEYQGQIVKLNSLDNVRQHGNNLGFAWLSNSTISDFITKA